jgi:hypothetical protein
VVSVPFLVVSSFDVIGSDNFLPMSMLLDTLLSLSLLVPLSTLTLYVFTDSLKLIKQVQQILHRIETIQKIQWELFKKDSKMSFVNGTICIEVLLTIR